jgi:hypothetical protein
MLADYDRSIVNLMGSIARARGGRTPYPPLGSLPARELDKKNLILLVMDGLGYEWLRTRGRESALFAHCRGPITSIVPSTTAAAITCFTTGVPAQQHGLTGWFVYLREVGAVTVPLPFHYRAGGPLPAAMRVLDVTPFSNRIATRSYAVLPSNIAFSAFTMAAHGRSRIVPFDGLGGLVRAIARTARLPGRKYVHAYWPMFDTLAHEKGVASKALREEFARIDRAFVRILAKLSGTDSTLVVTADHGEMDCEEIWVSDHPVLADALVLPLSGDTRFRYCYVRNGRRSEFLRYVKAHPKYWSVVESEEALARGWFGRGKPHPRLAERIGDYVLVMKNGYALRDHLVGESRHRLVAHHAGLSKDEMLVPLIVSSSPPPRVRRSFPRDRCRSASG